MLCIVRVGPGTVYKPVVSGAQSAELKLSCFGLKWLIFISKREVKILWGLFYWDGSFDCLCPEVGHVRVIITVSLRLYELCMISEWQCYLISYWEVFNINKLVSSTPNG